MEIRRPTWTLQQLCPECEQGDALMLCACPKCARLVAICCEEGSVFLDIHDIGEVSESSEEADCPSCGSLKLSSFVPATDVQIRQAGLRPGEYR